MELLEGKTLSEYIDIEGPQNPECALIVIKQILKALSFIHIEEFCTEIQIIKYLFNKSIQ